MNTAVQTNGARPKSVILDMADHYGMDPARVEIRRIEEAA